jgi:hypothetical protein
MKVRCLAFLINELLPVPVSLLNDGQAYKQLINIEKIVPTI